MRNYFAKPETKPTTKTSMARKPKISILVAFDSKRAVEGEGQEPKTIRAKCGKEYQVLTSGQIVRLSPKLRAGL